MSATAKPSELDRARHLPWHPLLFAVAIVLSFWVDTSVSPFAAVRSLVVVIGGTAAATALLALLLRSADRAGLVVSGILVLAWSKQLVRLGSGVVDRMDAWLAVVWLVILLLAVGLAARIALRAAPRIGLVLLTSVLNRVALLLLLASLLVGFLSGRFAAATPDLVQGVDLARLGDLPDGDATDLPDVYAVLLDGYPRGDALRHAFELDNSGFLAELERRGFRTSEEAYTDYIWTHVTLAATMNMAYLEDIDVFDDIQSGRAPRQPTLRHATTNGEVFAAARDLGYVTVAVHSGFEEVALRQADVFLDGGQMNEFELKLLLSTWLGDAVRVLAPDLPSAQQRDRIRHALAILPEVAAAEHPAPRLVVSHVPAPHSPIVFGPEGAPVTTPFDGAFFADSPLERGQDPDEFVAQYGAQLPYLNDLILGAVDGILEASNRPAVIVLFADHGSASRADWTATVPEEADPAVLFERTAILFAARTPERPSVYPDQVSPTDLFRHLFDAYAGTRYGPATPPAGGGQVPPVDPSIIEDGP